MIHNRCPYCNFNGGLLHPIALDMVVHVRNNHPDKCRIRETGHCPFCGEEVKDLTYNHHLDTCPKYKLAILGSRS